MILAVDVYYSDSRAKTVGVLFEKWNDAEPMDMITAYTHNPLEYEPGNFYKRELPCIQNLLTQVNFNDLDTIIVDGYVYLGDDKKPGLGSYVYQCCNERIPVIGVAKNSFHNNGADVVKVYRGYSAKPLFVTSAGMALEVAAANIQIMHGDYRFPYLLRLLDMNTKNDWDKAPRE